MCVYLFRRVNNMVKVEKNIKQPSHKTRPYKYPWDTLKVGDSFLMKNQHSPYSMLVAYNKKLPTEKRIQITTRFEGKGRRVWRIK